MAPMMMKLKLAAIAFGVAQAATKICAEDGAFDGTKTIKIGDQDPQACAMLELLVPGFTGTKEACEGDVQYGDEKLPAVMVMANFGGCCTKGSDVCSAFGGNPCATASDYKPDHTYKFGGDDLKCSIMAAQVGQFTPSATTCQAKIPSKDSGDSTYGMMTGLSAANGCCGTGTSSCAQFQVNPCADKTKFLPKAVIDGEADGIPCLAGMSVVAPFTPNTETCAEKITIDGKAESRTKHMEVPAKFCCSDKVSICANPPAKAATTKAAGGSSSDTSVSSGSVGACVANIFFAIVALVPHMLA